MRILPVFIIALLIIACNNSANKKEDTKDTAKPVARIPEPSASSDTIFTGFGTEPFWSVYVIKNRKIVFHPADGPDVEVPFVFVTSNNSNTTKYISANNNALIELTIVKKNCSDGMSDKTHPYEVALMVNKSKYSGCGRNE